MNRVLLSVVMFLALASTSFGALVYSPVTGHWYERVDALMPDGITWWNAKAAAESRSLDGVQGYLATITTLEENSWIVSNLGGAATLDHWLGGYLVNDSWTWVTGEPWSYSNWFPGDPSGDGKALQFDNSAANPILGYWNDLNENVREYGYIVEYNAPAPVPLPSAIWLFGSGLVGIIGFKKLKGNRRA